MPVLLSSTNNLAKALQGAYGTSFFLGHDVVMISTGHHMDTGASAEFYRLHFKKIPCDGEGSEPTK